MEKVLNYMYRKFNEDGRGFKYIHRMLNEDGRGFKIHAQDVK